MLVEFYSNFQTPSKNIFSGGKFFGNLATSFQTSVDLFRLFRFWQFTYPYIDKGAVLAAPLFRLVNNTGSLFRGHQYRINHMNYAIASSQISSRNIGAIDRNFSFFDTHCKFFTLYCFYLLTIF